MPSLTSIARTSGIGLVATFGFIHVAGATDPGTLDSSIYSFSDPVATESVAADLVATEFGVMLQPGDQPRDVEGIGQTLGSTALESLRGGDNSHQEVNIRGQVTGNTANRIISGTNSITDGAFANASGINTVIQNSGSNVLIQNGMVISVQFAGSGP